MKFRGEWEGRKESNGEERGKKKKKKRSCPSRESDFFSFFSFFLLLFFFPFEDHVGGGVTLGPPHYWLWWLYRSGEGPDRRTLKKPHKMLRRETPRSARNSARAFEP